ncbi:THAP domain-containing protein 4-like [Spodoptera litura]|uniref:THAP domain-containing protein 4-like n=1 Tax=Spodoptera litura TaxID=69820 RepID=A0A9J7EN87_SPOLT|nr:THAP domain-containing protein 4-like [Spodoptera litura]
MPKKPPKQECHECLEPIAWLIGRWVTEDGHGSYHYAPSFSFSEELEFIYSEDEPLFDFMSTAKHSNKPLSLYERGYLHMPNPKRVQLLNTHNYGYTASEIGRYKSRINEIKLKSVTLTAKPGVPRPYLLKTKRTFRLLSPDTLEYVRYLKTEITPMTQYLVAIFKKVE